MICTNSKRTFFIFSYSELKKKIQKLNQHTRFHNKTQAQTKTHFKNTLEIEKNKNKNNHLHTQIKKM